MYIYMYVVCPIVLIQIYTYIFHCTNIHFLFRVFKMFIYIFTLSDFALLKYHYPLLPKS